MELSLPTNTELYLAANPGFNEDSDFSVNLRGVANKTRAHVTRIIDVYLEGHLPQYFNGCKECLEELRVALREVQ